jgi:hypothetical protein
VTFTPGFLHSVTGFRERFGGREYSAHRTSIRYLLREEPVGRKRIPADPGISRVPDSGIARGRRTDSGALPPRAPV